MSYTYEGQLSTDKDDRKLGHMLGHMVLIPFPVWAGIKLIPAQRGNRIIIMWHEMCPNFLSSLSVDN